MSPSTQPENFFQLGYVTRDLEGAIARFRDDHQVAEFRRIDTTEPGGPPGSQIALAYSRGVMVEIIEPVPGREGIYLDALRPDGGISLHHLGYLVDDVASLDELAERFQATGIEIPMRFSQRLGLSAIYADTRPGIGHFSEFVFRHDEGKELFAQLPRN